MPFGYAFFGFMPFGFKAFFGVMPFGFKADTHFKIYFNVTLLTPFVFMPRPYLKANRAQILIHAKFSATNKKQILKF